MDSCTFEQARQTRFDAPEGLIHPLQRALSRANQEPLLAFRAGNCRAGSHIRAIVKREIKTAPGRTQIESPACPTAPARDLFQSPWRSLRVSRWGFGVVRLGIPIADPFPHVACHVLRAVGRSAVRIRADRAGIPNAQLPGERVVCVHEDAAWLIISPREGRVFGAPGGFFPFSFGGQAFPRPLAVCVRVFPAHIHHREIRESRIIVILRARLGGNDGWRSAGARQNAFSVAGVGDLEAVDKKSFQARSACARVIHLAGTQRRRCGLGRIPFGIRPPG